MAVKKHKLVGDNRAQLDLASLAVFIETYNTQFSTYLPPGEDLIKQCQDIVKCLARTPITVLSSDEVWKQLQSVEVFLTRVMNQARPELRIEIINAVVKKMYSIISDPQSEACPAASITLLVFEHDPDMMMSMARYLILESGNGPAGAGQRAALSCLYRWMANWQSTAALGDWALAFIKALEENKNFDILMEVTQDNMEALFLTLDVQAPRQNITDVVFHAMASMRDSLESFDKIVPHAGRVLLNLAADSGQWSRQVLQNAVDILTAMMERLATFHPGVFKEKYVNVVRVLERHMTSRGCRYLATPSWTGRCAPLADAGAPGPAAASGQMLSPSGLPQRQPRRVGLDNLGNTCYMNSIMQVLLVTRHFSRQVVLIMYTMPYWSKIAMLFTKMMHSIGNKLSPDELFHFVKPPFFTINHQHDSSEYLGYLLELLRNHEGLLNSEHDYTRPPPDTGRLRAIPPANSSNEDTNPGDPGTNRRSASPRPSSSSSSTCTASKRPPSESDARQPPAKRSRGGDRGDRVDRVERGERGDRVDRGERGERGDRGERGRSPTPRTSFIDSLFGGVLMTRVECTECRVSSLSRDVFRDLQLAFPEKPEPGKQHSVQSLLEYYCSKERLCGDNKYRCADCCALTDAEKTVYIEAAPKYLILVLKNFRFDPKLQVQTKLMHPMVYNQTVTLPVTRSQVELCTYHMYAAVIHSGTTLDSGHYYTIAKDNNQWTMYNDDVVTASKEADISMLTNCCTPYILFYRRADVEEGSVPLLQELPVELQNVVLKHNKVFVESLCKMRLHHT